MSKGRGLPTAAAVAILLCFFLPWISVSCGGNQIAEFSGYELAAGKELALGFSTEKIEGDIALFIVPLGALIAGGALWMAGSGSASPGAVKRTLLAGSIGGLIILVLKWAAMQENAQAGIEVTGEIGLWGTIGALLLLLYGGATYGAAINEPDASPSLAYRRALAPTATSAPAVRRDPPVCRHDGQTGNFCTRCGQSLMDRPLCQHDGQSGNFCTKCGQSLTGGPAVSEP